MIILARQKFPTPPRSGDVISASALREVKRTAAWAILSWGISVGKILFYMLY